MFKKLVQSKVLKFLICGAVTTAFNVVLIYALIEGFNINTPVLRNLANVVSLEISVIFSFFVYKAWVWSSSTWNYKEVIRREIPLFHFSMGIAIAVRSFILFPIFDWLGIHYTINTLMGILIGSIINYLACERIVFKRK